MNALARLSRRLRKQPGYSRPIKSLVGGISPPLEKEAALSHPILLAPIAQQLVVPLEQYRGAIATPVVKQGEAVHKGQVIASLNGMNIHAGTSGIISAIEMRPVAHASGLLGMCIVISADGKDTWHPRARSHEYSDYKALSPELLIAAIRDAGIAGLGGAGFPMHKKLALQDRTGIDTLIINAVECEPYIAADEALLIERAEHVVAGIEVLCHILKPRQCIIAIEDSKPKAIDRLIAALKGTVIELVIIPTRYPSGSEKQLIRILTGKELAHGQFPADIGIHCQNVGSCYAIHQAIVLGQPLVSRVCTITGSATAKPQNIEVTLGTPIAEALALCGVSTLAECDSIIIGGPLMGIEIHDEQTPITTTTNCVIASKAETFSQPNEQDCIRCGFCAQACPAKLLPQQLLVACKQGLHDQAITLGIHDCIECGACNYVCPSKIPLVQYYRAEKAQLRENTEKQQRARYWQTRFDAHQMRVNTEKATALDRRSRALSARAKAPDAPVVTKLHDEDVALQKNKSESLQTAPMSADKTKSDIQAALQRAKAKKAQRQNSATINQLTNKPEEKQ